jgi:antitoxin ParD1/3/4
MPNVNLGPHFERFVQEKLQQGRYQNASEVVRAGLRLLEDTEAAAEERRAAIRAKLAERAKDGRPTQPAAEVFDALRAHHQAQVKADKRGA